MDSTGGTKRRWKKWRAESRGRGHWHEASEDDKSSPWRWRRVVLVLFAVQLDRGSRMTSTTMIVRVLIACGVIYLASCASQNRFPQGGNQVSGSCLERNGRFPVAGQCDAYIECIDGVPEEKLCPEGLVFNPDARFNYPCGYPIDVDCNGRANLQPAQPTEHCPHQYGYFKLGDSENCGQFVNCVEGRGYVFDCPEGLAFNGETYRCDWPDQVQDCDVEKFLGFECPEKNSNEQGRDEIMYFRSANDCQRYFICLNGKPRLQNCGDGRAFDEFKGACDAAENVTGCATFGSSHEKAQRQVLLTT